LLERGAFTASQRGLMSQRLTSSTVALSVPIKDGLVQHLPQFVHGDPGGNFGFSVMGCI
jgi:hypothetical protein